MDNSGRTPITHQIDLDSVMLNLQYLHYVSEKFGLFAGAGFGAAMVATRLDWNILDEGKPDQNTTNFGWKAAVGVSFKASERASVEAGYRTTDFGKMDYARGGTYTDNTPFQFTMRTKNIRNEAFFIGVKYGLYNL